VRACVVRTLGDGGKWKKSKKRPSFWRETCLISLDKPKSNLVCVEFRSLSGSAGNKDVSIGQEGKRVRQRPMPGSARVRWRRGRSANMRSAVKSTEGWESASSESKGPLPSPLLQLPTQHSQRKRSWSCRQRIRLQERESKGGGGKKSRERGRAHNQSFNNRTRPQPKPLLGRLMTELDPVQIPSTKWSETDCLRERPTLVKELSDCRFRPA
jgi:hypothetical protein